MGSLKSNLFSKPEDPALERCLISDAAHIGPGVNDTTQQVTLIQVALETIEGVDLKSELGHYGPLTVTAVKNYKNAQHPPLHQPWQTTADEYVGKRTIFSLDRDMFDFENRRRGGGLEIPKDKSFVEQPAGEEFLITARLDNRQNDDLDAADRPLKASAFAQKRVAAAKARSSDALGGDMLLELKLLAGSLGEQFFFAFKRNNIVGVDKRFPDLNREVAKSGPFLEGHKFFAEKVEANLKAQFKAGLVDYHDLVTGNSLDRKFGEVVPEREPGKLTGRMLPSIESPNIEFSLTSDRALKTVIGFIQGYRIFLKNFKASAGPPAAYSATIHYEIIDHFGVNDSDCDKDVGTHGSGGQIAFWVLQHTRHEGGSYNPFRTIVDIENEIKGPLA